MNTLVAISLTEEDNKILYQVSRCLQRSKSDTVRVLIRKAANDLLNSSNAAVPVNFADVNNPRIPQVA